MCKLTVTIVWCRYCGQNDRKQTADVHKCRSAWAKTGQLGKCKDFKWRIYRPTDTCTDCNKYNPIKVNGSLPKRPSDSELESMKGGTTDLWLVTAGSKSDGKDKGESSGK